MFSKKKEPEFQFSLGDKVRDTITGFAGIVMSRSQWLNNCNTYGVQPAKLRHGGAPQDEHHFDENRLEALTEKVINESRLLGDLRGTHQPPTTKQPSTPEQK